MRNRTVSREITLHYLYQKSLLEKDRSEDIEEFLSYYDDHPQPALAFARELISGIQEKMEDIDRLTSETSSNWKIDRIAVIDMNIIRMGIYELLFRSDIPEKVTINEAIELAKKYSTVSSGSFINGILDTVRKKNLAADTASAAPTLNGSNS